MSKKRHPKDWSRKKILLALEQAGWKTINALAAHYGIAESTLRNAMCFPYPASEQRIAAALGLHPKVIWPSRYDEEGCSNRLPKGHSKRGVSYAKKPIPKMHNAQV